jgi:hypothetical protein
MVAIRLGVAVVRVLAFPEPTLPAAARVTRRKSATHGTRRFFEINENPESSGR